jgi:hypothetical protein
MVAGNRLTAPNRFSTFDGRDNQITNVFTVDAFGSGDEADGCAVTTIQRDGHTDHLTRYRKPIRSRQSTSTGWNGRPQSDRRDTAPRSRQRAAATAIHELS